MSSIFDQGQAIDQTLRTSFHFGANSRQRPNHPGVSSPNPRPKTPMHQYFTGVPPSSKTSRQPKPKALNVRRDAERVTFHVHFKIHNHVSEG